MSTKSELIPCPFCGGTPTIDRPGTARQSMIISCEDCGAKVESGDVLGFTKPKNYKWNQRHNPGSTNTDITGWRRGYFCALAAVLKANYGVGVHSPDILEFFKAGGDYRCADPEDIGTFKTHGLIP